MQDLPEKERQKILLKKWIILDNNEDSDSEEYNFCNHEDEEYT